MQQVKTAVFMAAGIGLRINRHIDNKPKGFIQIDGVALIERSMRVLTEFGVSRFIIGTGYQANYYEALSEKMAGIKLVKNPIYDQTNSFYTLYNLREHINDDFLLLESDLLYEKRAVGYLQQTHRKDLVLASGWTHSNDEVYIETDDNGILVNMSKDKTTLSKRFGELVGITRLSLDAYLDICQHFKNDDALARQIDYETALCTISSQHPIYVEKIDDLVWTEIDMASHLERARKVVYPAIQAKELL